MQVRDYGVVCIRQVEHQLIAVSESPIVCKYQVFYGWSVLIGDPWDFGHIDSIVIKAANFTSIINLEIPASRQKAAIFSRQWRTQIELQSGEFFIRSASFRHARKFGELLVSIFGH